MLEVGGTGDADELFGKTPRETPLEHATWHAIGHMSS